MTRDHGFVLIAVLLTLTLMAVIVTELAFSARLEASMVRSYRDRVLARHLAEAAVQQAIREIATPSQVAALDETGQLVFYRALPGQTTPTPLPALPRVRVALGAGEFSYRLIDESARLALNLGADRLGQLLEALGVERAERDIITDSVQDWRDADEQHRPTAPRATSTWRCRCPIARATTISRTRGSCSRSAASRQSSTRAPGTARGCVSWSPRRR
jgi:type II secretory pathway component PulK